MFTHSRVEDVDGLDGGFAFLFKPKHQVDPLAQRLGDLVRLQRLTVDQNEETRVVAGPGGQIHMIYPLTVLTHPKIKTYTDTWEKELFKTGTYSACIKH